VKHRAPCRPRAETGQPRQRIRQCLDFLTCHRA
jgi:hypothetical protein